MLKIFGKSYVIKNYSIKHLGLRVIFQLGHPHPHHPQGHLLSPLRFIQQVKKRHPSTFKNRRLIISWQKKVSHSSCLLELVGLDDNSDRGPSHLFLSQLLSQVLAKAVADFHQCLPVRGRAGNSVYLGSGATSQKKAQEPKTQEEMKKEEMGREKKKRRGVRRGKRGEEVGKEKTKQI